MKYSLLLLAVTATITQAHYTFPAFIGKGITSANWQHIRNWTNSTTSFPVRNVTSLDMRCNVDGSTASAPSTLSIAAGSKLSFKVDDNIFHNGPELAYLAKVPVGKTAANWDGSGKVWFKIHQLGPVFGPKALIWPNYSKTSITFTIPKATPSGEYLIQGEQIGLHLTIPAGGAEHYISCGQIKITGGGTGKPGPLVGFPGAYDENDAGLKINIYSPVPTNYTFPGPAVWSG